MSFNACNCSSTDFLLSKSDVASVLLQLPNTISVLAGLSRSCVNSITLVSKRSTGLNALSIIIQLSPSDTLSYTKLWSLPDSLYKSAAVTSIVGVITVFIFRMFQACLIKSSASAQVESVHSAYIILLCKLPLLVSNLFNNKLASGSINTVCPSGLSQGCPAALLQATDDISVYSVTLLPASSVYSFTIRGYIAVFIEEKSICLFKSNKSLSSSNLL